MKHELARIKLISANYWLEKISFGHKVRVNSYNLCKLVFLLFTLLLLLSCPFTPSTGDTGKVIIRFSGVSRTVLPDVPNLTHFDKLVINFIADSSVTGNTAVSKPDNEITYSGSYSVTVQDIVPGTYTLMVDAYSSETGTSQLAAKGSASISVSAAGPNNASINLKMILIEQGTTGLFSWYIASPDISVNKAEMKIEGDDVPTEYSTVNLLTFGNNNNASTPVTFPSGVYTAIITLEETEDIGTADDPDIKIKNKVEWYELIHIYSTLQSHMALTFTENYFTTQNYIVTFNYSYPAGVTGEPADKKQSVQSGGTIVTMPASPMPAGSGYYLAGWYTGQNGAGTEYTGTTPITGDITLYAKWLPEQVFNLPTLDMADKRPILSINGGAPITKDGDTVSVYVNTSAVIAITNYGTGAGQINGTSIEWKLNNTAIPGTDINTTTHTYTPSKPGMDLLTVRWQVGTVWYSTSLWIRVKEG